jgi:hypothetical protein
MALLLSVCVRALAVGFLLVVGRFWGQGAILEWFGGGGGGAAFLESCQKILFGAIVWSSLRWLLRAASL